MNTITALLLAISMSGPLVSGQMLESTTLVGKNCHFPFFYRGRQYNNCIRAESEERFWCSTSKVYNSGSAYEYCESPRQPIEKVPSKVVEPPTNNNNNTGEEIAFLRLEIGRLVARVKTLEDAAGKCTCLAELDALRKEIAAANQAMADAKKQIDLIPQMQLEINDLKNQLTNLQKTVTIIVNNNNNGGGGTGGGTVVVRPSTGVRCHAHWCYHFLNQAKNFADSDKVCATLGGMLSIPPDQRDANALMNFAKEFVSGPWWVDADNKKGPMLNTLIPNEKRGNTAECLQLTRVDDQAVTGSSALCSELKHVVCVTKNNRPLA